LARNALAALVGVRKDNALGGPFSLGPGILRPPPAPARPPRAPQRAFEQGSDDDNNNEHTEELLGELVDMVFVSADEQTTPDAQGEVHLVFKADVLGGLHLKLKKGPQGMHATFVVEDAAARRTVSNHVDNLVAHLKERGFTVAGHSIEIANT